MSSEESSPEKAWLSLSESKERSKEEFERRERVLEQVESELGTKHGVRDVELSVRVDPQSWDRVSIGSSSAMLSLVSGFFAALFESDAIDRGESVRMPDKVTLRGMRAVNALAFGALSRVRLTHDNLAEVMAAAQHCDVPSLEGLCQDFIREHVLDAKQAGRLMSDLCKMGFTKKSDEILDRMSPGMVNTLFSDPSSVHLNRDVFISVLRSDKLSMTEEDIWMKCVDWARHHSEDEDILPCLLDLKPYIRFALMTEEFLITEVDTIPILNAEELRDLIRFRYSRIDDDSLFCSGQPRSAVISHEWDKDGITPGMHSLSEDGTVLTHSGSGSQWKNAFVSGIVKRVNSSVEFEMLDTNRFMIGVMEASEISKHGSNGHFGKPFRGVGYLADYGGIFGPGWDSGNGKSFAKPSAKGDKIRVTVEFTAKSEATMVIDQNGSPIGHTVKLHETIDVTKGLRFAVQSWCQNSKIKINARHV